MATERKPTIPNSAIPPGSTILVTGANGLIATHIIEQSLLSGFKVRGTVRDTKRCAWVADYFGTHFGPDVFELFEVPDVHKEGYLDNAVKGCSAVIHTVPGTADFNALDPLPSTTKEIATVIYALEAARKEEPVKRFVLTTTAWTAGIHPANTGYKYDQNSWNEECIKRTYDKDPEPATGLQMFEAIKTRMEQEAWRWVKENKPGFVFNTVLPYGVYGRVIEPFKQSLKTTGAAIKVLYDGGPEQILGVLKLFGPHWYIDTEDNGKLHLITAIDPSIENERIFGHGGRWSYDDFLGIIQRRFPEKTVIENFNQGSDIGTVPTERGDELLKKHYGKGWKDLETVVLENLRSFHVEAE